MKRLQIWLTSFLFLLTSVYAKERLLVVTTLPDLASIAQEVGGEKVQAVPLAKGYQDPHYVIPSLKLMSVANKADLFVEIGLQLELWSEKVLDGARNPKIRPGQKGYVLASQGVRLMEIPKVLSRSGGDLHPYGNPHIWIDPLNAKIIAKNITSGLIRVSPENENYFHKRLKQFQRKISIAMYGRKLVALFGPSILDKLYKKKRLIPFLKKKKLSPRLQKRLGAKSLFELLGGWVKTSLAFRGKKIVFYHQSWIYFAQRFGLKIRGYVEEKPGISPSQAHRQYMIKLIQEENIPVIAVTNYYDDTIPRLLAKETGAKVVILPAMTGGVPAAKNYFRFMDYLLETLAKAYGD
ncbi:MAG: zinc ABC transporter substrate-binding protein [Planctomycetota bacterium]|nr:MAG: zinc ABC transporter substrate-binding protein [Planctomycetota bacterium]